MTTILQRKDSSQSAQVNFSELVSPLLQRIYSARNACCDGDVDYRLKNIEQPYSLKGLIDATDLLVLAMREQQRVLIVGDFDADGATSCALSILALKAMGLQQVNFLVPNRFEYGYGLTPEIVDVAKEYQPDLIVTVDNGIASVDGVAHAKSLGFKVIVTDHHLPPNVLPAADAIVNPNQQGCEFPSKNLAGVGVIFYLLSALRSRLRQLNWFVEQTIVEPNMASYLDLVALGTVADVVPLDRNNRTLVHQGIQRVKAGKARPGILALLEVAGKNYQRLTSQDFGFIVGPRLNAAGRLDDISLGIQCLLTDDAALARELAAQMDGLNRERRSIEASMQAEALASLNTLTFDESELPWGLCLLEENWHQGVVGILASRIKDKYHRPVIAFAEVDDDTIKGSARSIPGLHIRDALDMIATQNPEILQKFGGHAMAAGLSIERKNFTRFAQLFDRVVRGLLTQDLLQEILLTDGELSTREISLHNAHALAAAGPWGQQFPEPIFNGCFNLMSQRIVGEKHLKMTLGFLDDPQKIIDAIAFNVDVDCWPNADARQINIVYQLSINEFRGNETEQLIIRHIEVV
ncbi:MAG: single-stranded-DNA-specific exonuclease [Cellvibrionaceae bacterium]|jgi:single-stranded-DNA-specific exonuclease